MARAARVITRGLLIGAVLAGLGAGAAVAAQVPLPAPPALPPTNAPAPVEPYLVVAGPTVGAVCGTASVGALLAPSLVQGYFKIPLNSYVSGHTLTQYGNTALYVCGYIPSPLTPTECNTDAQIIDAVRNLNPLAAQLVGLYPEGAAVDTVLDIEQLVPASAGVATPLADSLSSNLHCARAGAVPPVPASASAPPATTAPPAIAAVPAPAPASPVVAPSAPAAYYVPPTPAPPAAVAVVPVRTAPAAISVIETRLIARHGLQWLALLLGLVLIASAAGARVWAGNE